MPDQRLCVAQGCGQGVWRNAPLNSVAIRGSLKLPGFTVPEITKFPAFKNDSGAPTGVKVLSFERRDVEGLFGECAMSAGGASPYVHPEFPYPELLGLARQA